jgi:hypothetical protein
LPDHRGQEIYQPRPFRDCPFQVRQFEVAMTVDESRAKDAVVFLDGFSGFGCSDKVLHCPFLRGNQHGIVRRYPVAKEQIIGFEFSVSHCQTFNFAVPKIC